MQINSLNQNASTNKKAPAFKATIHFVNEKEFAALKAAAQDCFEVGDLVNPKWIIEEAAVCKPIAATSKICNCIAGSIFNPETGLVNMFHITPWKMTPDKLAEIQQTITKQTINLKGASVIPLEGLLIGGQGKLSYTAESETLLLDGMKVLFRNIADSVGMTYSVLTGRKKVASVNLLSDARRNTHYVHYKSPSIGVLSSLFSDINATKLSKSFETKGIAPNDKLIINGKDVTEEFRRRIAG